MADSRTAAFGEGMAPALGNPENTVHVFDPLLSSLTAGNAIKGQNGMSASDAQRNLVGGTQLPTMNGMSKATYDQNRVKLSTAY